MLCIYIYYITYIYILYFYRVSGIVSGFHNWHKKMAVFWVLESLPILPYPNGISGDRSICWATSRSRDRGSPRQTSYFRTFGHLPKRHSDKATIDTIIVFNGVNWCEMGVQNCLSKIPHCHSILILTVYTSIRRLFFLFYRRPSWFRKKCHTIGYLPTWCLNNNLLPNMPPSSIGQHIHNPCTYAHATSFLRNNRFSTTCS